MARNNSKKNAPALTIEAREDQLFVLAYDLAEERLRNGTASAQEICYFLKQGSSEKKLEREKSEKEIKLLTAKTDSLEAASETKELYAKAISAMKLYSGADPDDDYEEF